MQPAAPRLAQRVARRLLLVLCLAMPAALAASAGGGDWARLSLAQREALAPLQTEWDRLDAPQRAKWLEMAARFPGMPDAERWRVQARMAEWARMTPQQRRQARQQFQQARKLPDIERAQHWGAFQSLPESEREALAQKAAPAARPTASAKAPLPAEKRNVVMTAPAPAPKAVSPVVQQARPGATTTTLTQRPQPPAHHQAGMPKIAATPGFVDPATLLPQRGPQGVASRLAASQDPASQP